MIIKFIDNKAATIDAVTYEITDPTEDIRYLIQTYLLLTKEPYVLTYADFVKIYTSFIHDVEIYNKISVSLAKNMDELFSSAYWYVKIQDLKILNTPKLSVVTAGTIDIKSKPTGSVEVAP